MTLFERCEKYCEEIKYEKNRKANEFEEIIEKFKEAFYNYDWGKLDSKYILKYQKQTIVHRSCVFLSIEFLEKILKLANIKDCFLVNKKFLNTLAKQKMLYIIYYNQDATEDYYIKIFLDEYFENKKSYQIKELDEYVRKEE